MNQLEKIDYTRKEIKERMQSILSKAEALRAEVWSLQDFAVDNGYKSFGPYSNDEGPTEFDMNTTVELGNVIWYLRERLESFT